MGLPLLDAFFDEMMPALIREKLESSNGSFMAKVLEVGCSLSESVEKPDVRSPFKKMIVFKLIIGVGYCGS